jgi:Domain of unknown function (DUF397)
MTESGHADLTGAVWRKSSRTSPTSNNCVEVATVPWRKSSHSSPTSNNCVEVATGQPGVIAVRDSKDPDGPALILTQRQWRALLADVRSDGFCVSA